MIVRGIVLLALCSAAADPDNENQRPVSQPARAVLEQVLSANRAIKTLDLSFQIVEHRLVDYGPANPPVTITWEGTYSDALPDRFRIEYRSDRNDDVITSGVGDDGNHRFLKLRGSDRVFDGTIAASNKAELNAGPSPGIFITHLWLSRLEGEDVRDWTVETRDGCYILAGTIVPYHTSHRLTIDPARGNAVVQIETSFDTAAGRADNVTKIAYSDAAPGAWIAQHATTEQRLGRHGVTTRWEFDAVPATIRVNAPVDKERLSIVFPQGCRVTDRIAKRSYFVGGDTRNARTIESLATEVDRLAQAGVDPPSPSPGALSAAPTWFQRWGQMLAATVLLAIAVVLPASRYLRNHFAR